jgi:acetyltransferase
MISDGVEVLVGFKQDSRFGPMVTFGLGGIFVELLRDVSLRMAPLDEDEALTMIRETKAYPLLAGFRGQQPRDVAALSQVLVAVSQLAQDFREELAELDVNPLMVLPKGQGVRAVDALTVLSPPSAK